MAAKKAKSNEKKASKRPAQVKGTLVARRQRKRFEATTVMVGQDPYSGMRSLRAGAPKVQRPSAQERAHKRWRKPENPYVTFRKRQRRWAQFYVLLTLAAFSFGAYWSYQRLSSTVSKKSWSTEQIALPSWVDRMIGRSATETKKVQRAKFKSPVKHKKKTFSKKRAKAKKSKRKAARRTR